MSGTVDTRGAVAAAHRAESLDPDTVLDRPRLAYLLARALRAGTVRPEDLTAEDRAFMAVVYRVLREANP